MYVRVGGSSMSVELIIVIGILYYMVTVALILVVLNFMHRKNKNSIRKQMDELERDKNLVISASLIAELNKVEPLIDNSNMKSTLVLWQKRFKKIKEEDVPRITDALLQAEELYANKDFKTVKKKLSEIEMDIYYVRTKADFLLEEIKEITLSEERNRETITKLKASYREILMKYQENKNDYTLVSSPLELQFENVDKLFSAFEVAMENKSYQEVSKIVKAIDDLVGNLKLVIDEAPTIIMLGKNIIPKKITDITNISKKMEKDGYNLEYLNIPYNVTESSKKITDIFQRLNVLNIEDSIFELKTMLDYFDSIYNEFDKEKISRKIYNDYLRTILIKITKLTKINDTLLKRLDDIKYSYDLNDEDVEVVFQIKEELASERGEYDDIIDDGRSKKSSYSHLGKLMELLNVKVLKTEEKLEVALRTLGSLKEDELRAREQLDEMKQILESAKVGIKSFKLPLIPENYFVELAEATEAIANMVKELEKTPISIKVLNTRVDTARDLVLKVYNTTKEIVKTAKMAETAIVYGNRYRPVNTEVDIGLMKAEKLFFQGKFKNSLEQAIHAINVIEPGIYKKLMDDYQN